MQGLLEQIGIPYTGCGVMASALTMDKMRTKMLWKRLWFAGSGDGDCDTLFAGRTKSACCCRKTGTSVNGETLVGGSSVGLTKVKAVDDLKRAVEFALKFDETVLIEEWLSGDELTVPVLDNEVLPSIKIVPEA